MCNVCMYAQRLGVSKASVGCCACVKQLQQIRCSVGTKLVYSTVRTAVRYM